MKLSKYFYDSQKAHNDLIIKNYKKGDGLTAIYHNTVYEQQEKQQRVLSNVEKKIIYLQVFKAKLMKEEKYDASKSWVK